MAILRRRMLAVVDKALVHLVDDDDGVRGTLARLLLSGGYAVREYASGDELLKAEDLENGFILLDIDMPGADGSAVHKALTERSIHIPVIMMTGGGDLTVLAFKAGAAEFMQTPFGRGEILTVLAQLRADERLYA
jgi:two-component system, LuxR family, response regulator FixJ